MSGGDRPFMCSVYSETEDAPGQQGRRGTYGRPIPKSDVDPMSPIVGRIVSIHRPSLPYTEEQGSNSQSDGSVPQTGRSSDFHIHFHLRDDSANSANFQRRRQQQYAGDSQGFGIQTDKSLYYDSQHSNVQVPAQ